MARNMSQAIFSLLLIFLLRLLSVARAQTCTVGDHADSTRFGTEFVFGLPVSGQYSSYLGDYGNFIQTSNSGGTYYYASRPARSESGQFSTSGMPSHAKIEYTAESSVTRDTGLHDGTLRVLPDYNLIVYLFGSNTNEGTYGATAVTPLVYLGQEYFASVLAGPGLGQVVISSTGETTFIRLTPNGPFTYDGITYSSPFSDLEVEIPAWYQMIITTSSNDFTGSRILANKTVSVLSGSSCAYSPEISSGSCDYAIEHLLPYDKWGTTFNVPPFQDGSTGYYIQITAGRDDTTINVDGTLVSIGQGQTESREVTTNTMLRITSDKPIQVVQILKGAASMVVIPPEEQYTLMNSYFRISGADTLGIYLNHYFTIVVPCSSQSGIYVTGTAPGDNVYLKTASSSTAKGSMCAYFYTGGQTFTYTISQSDPNGAFTVLNYARDGTAAAGDGSAGYAYVGAQKFQTQRCLDYHTIIYGSDVTTQATTTQATTTKATTTQQQLPK
ncbi:uncharacterized protein LOC105443889 [Strongylocentrotus purpuratus]|uniref:IgGFc-binding protein N-terminal domain-containing protein n=1 Tax=Strongylocentrotus purpuratus TaxID=7668 RepID=A0A7M7N4I9_STRPU|nr:uncharacterized protein LOC105443889 [Strongylocentrotus purpuratus]